MRARSLARIVLAAAGVAWVSPRAALAIGLDAPTPTPAPAPAAAGTPAATVQQSVAIFVFPDDGGAAATAQRTAATIARRAQQDGFRPVNDPRVVDLLDRSPEDLARTASALAEAHAAYKQALEENGRLRLDAAQENLLRARSAILDAACLPDYEALRQVHLYMGIVALNLGQPDAALAQLRTVAFLAPNLQLNRDLYAPSVQEAFANAKKSLSTGAKGGLRIEVDGVKTAQIVFDGVPKGPAPKTLSDLPEGDHYLEVRAAGASPQLIAVTVLPAIETPTIVTMRPAGAPMRAAWMRPDGEQGGAAIAKILETDRLVLGETRSTVTGVSPFAIRAATFDASLGRRIAIADTTAARDMTSTDIRLQKLAAQLMRSKPPAETVAAGASSTSYAALVASRSRFLDRDATLLTLEAGLGYQDHMFDAHGHYVATTKDQARNQGEWGFKSYLETRTVVHARYGLKENATLIVDVPFYTKTLQYDYDDGNGLRSTKRTASGLGDVTLGADVRLPRYESPRLALLYLAARVKMPSGQSAMPGYLRRYERLILGSGQWDLYGGLGGIAPVGENGRFGFELGYTARLPDRVDWSEDDGNPHYLNIGDEEHVHVDAADQMTRFLAPEVSLDFTHRHATQKLQDPISFDGARAREMYLVNLGAAVRAQFSETSEGGVVLQHPVWGKITKTLFPLDVTGPRLFVYYGIRF